MNRQLVCLIIPPSLFLLDERVFVNLGILKVAAALELANWPVEVLDLSGVSNFEEVVAMHASVTKGSIFGLTSTTPQFPSTTKIAKVLRRIRPAARLIVGGPHPTLVVAALRRERRLGIRGRASRAFDQLIELFDVTVAGDGEDAIFLALEGSDRVVDADSLKSPLFLDRNRLNALPLPARHLVDLKSYKFLIDGEPATSLIAQLGCPFACGFCSGRTSPMLRNIRLRTTKSVIAELKHLFDVYGYRGFMFYDDELNVNPNMLELMEAITRLQTELGVRFKLRGCVKAELFNEKQGEAMRRAGFSTILVGFESGSEKILFNINKKATRSDNTRCLEICRRHGIRVKALMSVGHPGESEETIRATEDWLLENKPDEFNLTIITCTPGTFYYDHAIPMPGRSDVWTYTYPPTGDRLHSLDVDYSEIMDYYNGDSRAGYRSFVFTDDLSPADLVRLRDETEARVRNLTGVPYYTANQSVRYDQSMGQLGILPQNILKTAHPTITA